jgi:hypothetical protein
MRAKTATIDGLGVRMAPEFEMLVLRLLRCPAGNRAELAAISRELGPRVEIIATLRRIMTLAISTAEIRRYVRGGMPADQLARVAIILKGICKLPQAVAGAIDLVVRKADVQRLRASVEKIRSASAMSRPRTRPRSPRRARLAKVGTDGPGDDEGHAGGAADSSEEGA